MAANTILFATDYSEVSQGALPLAAALAERLKAKLLIAHVSDRELYPIGEQFNEDFQPNEDEIDRLKRVAPPAATVTVEHRLLFGTPGSVEKPNAADEILALAEAEDVDAIVLGTHGRSGLAHFLMGSVAEAVVRRAHCRVITVKPPTNRSGHQGATA